MQYLLSTFRFRFGEFRLAPVIIVLSVALVGGFWLGAVYYRATPIGNFLRVGSVNGPVTTVAAEAVPGVTMSTEQAPAADARVAVGPMISFNFDNGYESAYLKALPIFDRAGFKTTQYIITSRLGFQGYVNEAQLRYMAKRGHEIGAMSQTLAHLTQVSRSEARAEIEGSREDLLDLGYSTLTFAYPYGESNISVEEVVDAAGFVGARTLGAGLNDQKTNVYGISGLEVRSDTKFSEIKGAIDAALLKKEWLVLVFGRVDDIKAKDGSSVSSELLKQIVQYVQATRIAVVTMEQGLSG